MQNAFRTIKFVGISWIAFALAYSAFKVGTLITIFLITPSLSH